MYYRRVSIPHDECNNYVPQTCTNKNLKFWKELHEECERKRRDKDNSKTKTTKQKQEKERVASEMVSVSVSMCATVNKHSILPDTLLSSAVKVPGPQHSLIPSILAIGHCSRRYIRSSIEDILCVEYLSGILSSNAK